MKLAVAVTTVASVIALVLAHGALSAYAIDAGMAGSLLGRPDVDTARHVTVALQLLALRTGLVLVVPGAVCAIVTWLVVSKTHPTRVSTP